MNHLKNTYELYCPTAVLTINQWGQVGQTQGRICPRVQWPLHVAYAFQGDQCFHCPQHRSIVWMENWGGVEGGASPSDDVVKGQQLSGIRTRRGFKAEVKMITRVQQSVSYTAHNVYEPKKLLREDNGGLDLAMKTTSCQCPPLSCPSVPFTKSLS